MAYCRRVGKGLSGEGFLALIIWGLMSLEAGSFVAA
jgi:hypothetical protein